MKFYSYEYLQSKIAQMNRVEIIIGGILIFLLAISLWKYYKDRKNSKYRELSIIMILGIVLLVGTEISNYESTSVTTDQYKSSVKFIEAISDHLHVDKTHIYINSEASIENSFVKVDDAYYRVISSGKKDEYLLEKIELIDPVIEKVEVTK